MKRYPWLKLWNEAPDDPKFLAAADMAGARPGDAFYAWAKALSYANANESDRGSIEGLHPQVIASYCRIALDEAKRILQAFRDLGMVVGNRIAKWAKRQTEKVTDKAAKLRSPVAERVARHRARKSDAARQPDLFPGSVTRVSSVTSGVSFDVTRNAGDTPQPIDTHGGFGALLEVEEEEDYSEAIASEREPDYAEVVQIDEHRREKKGGRGHRKSRISADWQPDLKDRQHAAAKGYDLGWVEREAERFRDHHLKTGALYADWNAAWRTWVGRAVEFAGRNCSQRSGSDREGPGSILAALSRIDDFRAQI